MNHLYFLISRFALSALIITLLGTGCTFEEKYQGPFIEPTDEIYQQIHLNIESNHWIRKSENLYRLHQTILSIGYDNIISQQEFSSEPFIFNNLYFFSESPKEKLLLLSKCLKTKICDEYSGGFLKRRSKEGTLEITRTIVRDLESIFISNQKVPPQKELVNPILEKLLRIKFSNRETTKQQYIKDVNFLIDYGFHQSAYNLLYEHPEFWDYDVDRNSFYKRFIRTDKRIDPWIEDQAK